MGGEIGPLKTIAYLSNQYPMASLTFVRREIAAIEALDGPVRRYAIRSWSGPLVDPDDRAEAERTRRILDVGPLGLVRALLTTALTRPSRFVQAAGMAGRLGLRALSPRGLALHLAYLAEACVLRGWAERDQVNHLHVHFGTNSATVALLCRLLGGPPYSFTVHGPEEFDRPVALGLQEKIRGASFVVAVSSFGRSQLWRWAELADWPKVAVIHCGVDPAFLDPMPAPEPTAGSLPRLINIGRLEEQKGQVVLIEAAARLRQQGRRFTLALIGDGTLRPALEARIERLGLGDCVTLLGWRTGPEIRHELLRARGLVLPSFAEGLPVVIMEALALRRPVVSTSIAGIPELVQPGLCGWLVPAGDVDALASAMAELLDAPDEQLDAMGAAGRDRVARDHDVRIEAGKLLRRIRDETGIQPNH